MSERLPIERDYSPSATKLYFFFGGIAAGIAMPPFEFYRAAQVIEENKMFVRDFTQSWYQTGLPGISSDVHSTARFIRKEIDEVRPGRVFFVGNSMGGYAAILFSALADCGEAIAFAPQTFVSPLLRRKHQDRRWSEQISRMYWRTVFKPKLWDLKKLLLGRGQPRKVSIFVSSTDSLDDAHAEHLRGTPGVAIHKFDSGGHGVVRLLRDRGDLPSILAGQ